MKIRRNTVRYFLKIKRKILMITIRRNTVRSFFRVKETPNGILTFK